MSKAIIGGTPGFTYTAEVRALDGQSGTFVFAVTTAWSEARQPGEERQVLQLTTDAAGLRALRDLIATELA